MSRLLRCGRNLARLVRRYGYPIPFIARRYIRQMALQHAHTLPQRAICLDIGAGVAPYRLDIESAFNLGLYVSFDLAASDATTVVGDAARLPLPSASIYIVVSMDVLQHISDVGQVLNEIYRVLAPGGIVILSFPFSYGECDLVDFFRWSVQGMTHELKRHGLEIIDARRRGGTFFAAACALQWLIQHAIPGARRAWRQNITPLAVLRSVVVQMLMIPALVLGWIALLVDGMLPVSGLYMGGLITARRAILPENPSDFC